MQQPVAQTWNVEHRSVPAPLLATALLQRQQQPTLSLNELSFYSYLFCSAAKNFVREGPVSDVVSRWRLFNSWKLTWSASKNPSMFVSRDGDDLSGFIIAAALHLLSSTVYCKMNDLSWQRINTSFSMVIFSNFICFLVLTLFDVGAHHIQVELRIIYGYCLFRVKSSPSCTNFAFSSNEGR